MRRWRINLTTISIFPVDQKAQEVKILHLVRYIHSLREVYNIYTAYHFNLSLSTRNTIAILKKDSNEKDCTLFLLESTGHQ